MALQFQPKRVTEIRKALGLTKAEFARKVGVSRQLIGFWEQGRYVPGTGPLLRLAAVTGAKMESFFAETPHTQSVARRARRTA